MNPEIILVLVQYRFRCSTWSYFVIVLATYEKTGRLTGKKPNNFSRLANPPNLLLNLPKIKNRKTPEGTALGQLGRVGPQRANTLSGWQPNVSFERSQLGEGEGLLVILPTAKEGKDFRPPKQHTGGQNVGIRKRLIANAYNFKGLEDLRLHPAASNLHPAASLCNSLATTLATKPAGRMRVLLVLAITLTEANQ